MVESIITHEFKNNIIEQVEITNVETAQNPVGHATF
jgi:hypothetical protein